MSPECRSKPSPGRARLRQRRTPTGGLAFANRPAISRQRANPPACDHRPQLKRRHPTFSPRTGDGSIASRRTAQSSARHHEPRRNTQGGRMSADRRSPTEWSKRLAETLVGAGRIPGDTAAAMLSEAASSGRPVAAVLADRGLVEPAVSLSELARISGIPSVDISEKRPLGEAFRLVPELFARELKAIGYKLEGEHLRSEERRVGEACRTLES